MKIAAEFPFSNHKTNGQGRNRQPASGIWKAGNFNHGADFNSAPTTGGTAGGGVDGFVEVFGIDHKEAAELLAGFGEGPSVMRRLPCNGINVLENIRSPVLLPEPI